MTKSAAMVYLLRTREGRTEVLLQKRGPKSFGMGLWDASAAGHVEEGESMTDCARRELTEEIGVDFDTADIVFFTMIHVLPPDPMPLDQPYYDGHFFVEKFSGDPKICEGEKCMQLKWFNIDELPDALFGDRGEAIQNFKNKVSYSERGWHNSDE
jgi:8-oxo-dGTP pyrophosphatase MutT (NUDIX family)